MDSSFFIDFLERAGVNPVFVIILSLLVMWYFTIKRLRSILPFFSSQSQRAISYVKGITLTITTVLFIILGFWITWNLPRVIKYTGTLTPHSDSIQPLSSPLFPYPKREKLPSLEIGDSCSIFVYTGKEREPIFTLLEKYSLVVEVINKQIVVSTKIFDRNGNFIAGLDQNTWEVNPQTSYKFNYTDEALEVIDPRDQVILQVRVLPDRIQLQGEWWNEKRDGVRIAKSADIPEPSIVWWAKGEDPNLEKVPPIQRIFKYPAKEHLGETIVPLIQAPSIENCGPKRWFLSWLLSREKPPVIPRPPRERR